MNWIKNYQLFLFDFDGLLVDTEHLHHQAYSAMCAQRGFHLNWTFHRFSEAAHHSSTGLQQHIYAEFPELQRQEPHWPILYKEKQQQLIELAASTSIQLMPGVATLLQELDKAQIKRCVVTNSSFELIEKIRQNNSLLNTIPHWITRKDYEKAKPNSECYLKAISLFAKPSDRIIGFEDSPKGLQALLQTPAKAVLICPKDAAYLADILQREKNIDYYASFEDISEQCG